MPDGMSYRLLILAGGNQMTFAAATKLRALVCEGATVLGPIKPVGSPSLSDSMAGDEAVRKIAAELWGADALRGKGEHQTGAGQMLWGITPAQALAKLGMPRDFDFTSEHGTADLLCAHRQTLQRDIYFVANHEPHSKKIVATFRMTGRIPERWDVDTGAITEIGGWREIPDQTEVPLTLEANASTFVVFRKQDDLPKPVQFAETNLVAEMPVRLELTGPWSVRFTPGWGAPELATFTNLISWTDCPDAGIRNYSGAATYTKEFDLPALRPGERIILDLGKVAVLASVKLNGQDLGVVWKQPFALDVTRALRAGRNTIEIRVVNLWVNRLIADAALPVESRLTWASWNPYHAGDPLLPSGLLGPVILRLDNSP